jgi:hypothetical protein
VNSLIGLNNFQFVSCSLKYSWHDQQIFKNIKLSQYKNGRTYRITNLSEKNLYGYLEEQQTRAYKREFNYSNVKSLIFRE